MISYAVMTAFEKTANEICTVSKALNDSAGAFYHKLKAYAAELKETAQKFNLSVARDVADVEARLITAETDDAGVRQRNRKLLDKRAAELNAELQEKINEFLARDKKIFEECRDLWRQIIVGAVSKGGQVNVKSILETVKADAELYPYYLHILSRAGSINTGMLLEEQLNLYQNAQRGDFNL